MLTFSNNILFIFMIFFLQNTPIYSQITINKNFETDKRWNYSLKGSTDKYIFDGILISNEIRIPQNLIIDRTWKVKDSVLLKELGIINFNESFTFYSSIVTSFHIFIYNKVNISNNLKKLNPPIRVNGLLITPENYSNLLLKDTVNIKSINFIPSKKLVEFYNLPIGIIDIQLK